MYFFFSYIWCFPSFPVKSAEALTIHKVKYWVMEDQCPGPTLPWYYVLSFVFVGHAKDYCDRTSVDDTATLIAKITELMWNVAKRVVTLWGNKFDEFRFCCRRSGTVALMLIGPISSPDVHCTRSFRLWPYTTEELEQFGVLNLQNVPRRGIFLNNSCWYRVTILPIFLFVHWSPTDKT